MRIRPERVAERIKRETADILESQVRDPRVAGRVSVTDVEVTQDLSFARIYVSVTVGADREAALTALAKAAPYVRRQLAPRLQLREVPEIRFLMDDSIERGARVEYLLRKLAEGEKSPDEDEA